MASSTQRIALKNILFLTDFSEPSAEALPFAAMIARAYDSRVTALHVVTPSTYAALAADAAAAVLDAEEELANTEMARVAAALAGVAHETIIERGVSVWEVLSRILQENEVDLIALGTHGRTGLKKMLLGSSAEEVFRRAPVPVLSIGPAVKCGVHNGGRFHSVLLATELSDVSKVATPYAISLAQENQSRLTLLHVLPTPKPGKPSRPAGLSVAEAIHQLEELVPKDAELWCRPEPAVEHGEPSTQILAVANRCGADLIVLGVRGMDVLAPPVTRVEHAVAYKVVAEAPCPVLTVRG